MLLNVVIIVSITFELVGATPRSKVIARIADSSLPFGGAGT
jgi:hypothetical protein